MDTIIITDSSCDLPLEFIEKNSIPYLGLICHLSYRDFEDDFGKTIDHKDFYKKIREGEMPTTSQINTYRFAEKFKQYVKENKSIIYIGMSSAISGCIGSALVAKNTVIEEFPNADITIIDTKSASIGQGLLVYKAVEMLKNNYSKNDIVEWLESNKCKINHWFIVDNLMHLKRGGRLSKTSAAVGTLLNIKPIIFINNNGELINAYNIRGRKKAMKTLIDLFEKNGVDFKNTVVGISHGDCLEDALYLKELVLEKFNVKDVILSYVGAVIGSHTGPGMLALCFIGESRNFSK